MLGIFQGSCLIAARGLNVDPYIIEVCTGRIRHVVLKRARRQGVATTLVSYLLNYARPSFRSVRLFTDTKGGAMSYEALGFNPSLSPTASHEIAV